MMNLRRANKEDAYGVEYVAAHTWYDTYQPFMPLDYLTYRVEHIEERVPRVEQRLEESSTYHVLTDNDKVIGILHYKPNQNEKYKDYGYLESIYILTEYHGQGLGKQLFKKAIEGLIAMGYNDMYLECIVGNPTMEFYKKYTGYVIDEIDFPIADFSVRAHIVLFNDLKKILAMLDEPKKENAKIKK